MKQIGYFTWLVGMMEKAPKMEQPPQAYAPRSFETVIGTVPEEIRALYAVSTQLEQMSRDVMAEHLPTHFREPDHDASLCSEAHVKTRKFSEQADFVRGLFWEALRHEFDDRLPSKDIHDPVLGIRNDWQLVVFATADDPEAMIRRAGVSSGFLDILSILVPR